MRQWHEYILKVRPHRKRYVKKSMRSTKPTTAKVVARSKFDAELAFRNANPGMFVVKAERGQPVEPPQAAN